MQSIKVDFYLPKFQSQYIAELVAVKDMLINNETSKKYLEYESGTFAGDVVKIEPGRYIQLVFLGEKGIPFTHLRPYSAAAKALYKHQVGKDFKIDTDKGKGLNLQADLFDDVELKGEESEYDSFKKWRKACNSEVV